MAVLKKGSKGAEVATLQRVLGELGFGITADGDFGERTHQAVKAAQAQMGLTADGLVGPATWDALDKAYQPGVDNWTSSGVLTAQQVAEAEAPIAKAGEVSGHPKLQGVHPKLAAKMVQLIQLAAADGVTLRVTQGVRTFAEQDALYAQGRTKPGRRVTAAKAGSSQHNFGTAADVCVVLDGKVTWDEAHYRKISEWARKVGGLSWGGDWASFRDLPHLQLDGLPPTSTMLATYRAAGGGNAGIAAVWSKHA